MWAGQGEGVFSPTAYLYIVEKFPPTAFVPPTIGWTTANTTYFTVPASCKNGIFSVDVTWHIVVVFENQIIDTIDGSLQLNSVGWVSNHAGPFPGTPLVSSTPLLLVPAPVGNPPDLQPRHYCITTTFNPTVFGDCPFLSINTIGIIAPMNPAQFLAYIVGATVCCNPGRTNPSG
jgi:hypothetical protein